MSFERYEVDWGPVQLICSRIVGNQSDAQVEAWMAEYLALLEDLRRRRLKLVSILDLSQAGPLTAPQRRMQSDWNERHEPLVRELTLGLGFVVSSVVMRGVITAVFWLKPPSVPHAVCNGLEDAVYWAMDRCQDARFRVSSFMHAEARRVLLSPPEARRA